ncbi:MAG: hypothetical protein WCV93_04250 [Candidatus Shapirobacteria bacterium]
MEIFVKGNVGGPSILMETYCHGPARELGYSDKETPWRLSHLSITGGVGKLNFDNIELYACTRYEDGRCGADSQKRPCRQAWVINSPPELRTIALNESGTVTLD